VADFDLIAIGSGPAGEKGAVQAAYFGKRVAVVERSAELGGAKIHACALPAKNLRETALALSGLRQRHAPGVSSEVQRGATMSDLLCRQEPVRSAEIARVERNLRAHQVTLLRGHARFVGERRLHIDGVGEVSADVILVATGSRPHRPRELPWGAPFLVDSDGILALPRLPESLVVVGGGVVGCEMASMFAPLGVRMTLIDQGPRLLGFADCELSAALASAFAHAGIAVMSGSRAARIEAASSGGGEVVLDDGRRVRGEVVLFSGGRIGNTADLDLPAAGLTVDAKSRLTVDACYRTAQPGIYAAGDVIGFPALASTAMEQARIAMCHAFDLKYKKAMSPILPLGIYTIPELSMVGDSAESAARRGIAVEVGRAYYRDNPRGQLAGDQDGMLKLVFAREGRRLLGAHIVGERATELIHVAATCLQLGGSADTFIDAVYNFPTLSELYKYAAYDALARLA